MTAKEFREELKVSIVAGLISGVIISVGYILWIS